MIKYDGTGIPMEYNEDWDQHKAMPVTVTCTKYGVGYPETEVEILDIEEDIQGFDVVIFKCPECKVNHRSYRRG